MVLAVARRHPRLKQMNLQPREFVARGLERSRAVVKVAEKQVVAVVVVEETEEQALRVVNIKLEED